MKNKNRKNKLNSISRSESKVLHVLWQNQPLSGKQIALQINDKPWSFVTIKTLINRLLKKEFLSYEKQGRQYLYSTLISKNEYLNIENSEFVERMYNGSFSGLFASFTEQEKISTQELNEIKKIIEEMEQNK